MYRVPNANAGPDDAVCGAAYKLAAVKSDGTGSWTWEAAAQVVAPFPVAYNSTVYVDSSYTVPYKKYKFYWSELNGICPKKDSVYITFDNRIDTISAGVDTTIMTFDNITRVNAYPKLPFEKGNWSVVAGSGNFVNDTLCSTYVENISLGLNTFKWSITNGKCLLESLVNFDVSKPVIPQGISPNGDGINDSLIINGIDTTYQEIELTILNGAGAPVFTASYGNGKPVKIWDGKNSKGAELPEGTYYYLLKVFSTSTRHVSQEKGFIILKRN
jgi:gliding motility-associated-like protein